MPSSRYNTFYSDAPNDETLLQLLLLVFLVLLLLAFLILLHLLVLLVPLLLALLVLLLLVLPPPRGLDLRVLLVDGGARVVQGGRLEDDARRPH